MKESKGKVPRFKSESEEAQWWFDHREETAGWLEKAIVEGRTTSLAGILQKRREAGPTPTVSIRIDPADVTRARVLAEKRGLRYQTYLKMLLHEALERENRRLTR
jgi:hypothetical protein